MPPVRVWLVCACLLFASSSWAADLTRIERRIAREPVYQSKPLYCLALLGHDARTRVWMVLDGERLYVDKNCNGDLTDDGPPAEIKGVGIDPSSFDKIKVSPDGRRTVYLFEVTLWNRPSAGGLLKRLQLFSQSVHVNFPDGRWFGAWGDHVQPLMFASEPRQAPVLHYGGDLRMGFEIRKPVEKTKDGFKLSACVGTPGSRPGAWVHLLYTTIPPNVHPEAVIEFPPEKPGGPPVRVTFVLGRRC
jgi:hypothetical protein